MNRWTKFALALMLVLQFFIPTYSLQNPKAKLTKKVESGDAPDTSVEPVPFRFMVDEITLVSKGRVLLKDSFDREGRFQPAEVGGKPADKSDYYVSLGHLNGTSVKGGVLTIDQTNTINAYGDFVFKFIVPVDERGAMMFAGADNFGDLVFTVKLRAPRLNGHERFKVGFGDLSNLGGLASISLQKNSVSLQRQGRTAWEETLLKVVDISEYPRPDQIELSITVGAQGQLSGMAKVTSGGKDHDFPLQAQDPRARINPANANLSANIFIESIPKPRIFAVYPPHLTAQRLREMKGELLLKVFGTGFAADSRVELIPAGDDGKNAIEAEETQLVYSNSVLAARVMVQEPWAAAYTVSVISGSEKSARRSAIRILN